MADQEKKKELTPKQERFCQLYVSQEFFGNGVQAYIEAYGLDPDKSYDSARRAASENLTKLDICARINELLDDAGLNDGFVDKQLLLLISQHADFAQKMAAIREYNKLRQRITEKMEHSGEIKLPTLKVEVVKPDEGK